ncbi:hypothetical protein M378DRAFT_19341 [Amanita muscaria Koide BX008]|uniref:Uncharacterized protein n=1 Tax=Amanita muscaria (strain Koide BX008) TaxID=946122 RepID=A0A0C2WBL6_AMAMK|nr:hypothetical protein M378DRAFT_19341 [Amanita muscaria Koide BX008]
MPPSSVKRDHLYRFGHFSVLADVDTESLASHDDSPYVDTLDQEVAIGDIVSEIFNNKASHYNRAQAFYTVFNELALVLQTTSQFKSVMERIADDLQTGNMAQPCNLPHAQPCTLSHAEPCTLSHDPVTITVTKEVHPTTCSDEMKKLRKEISDLKSKIGNMKKDAKSSDDPVPTAKSAHNTFASIVTSSSKSRPPTVDQAQSRPPTVNQTQSIRFEENNPKPYKPLHNTPPRFPLVSQKEQPEQTTSRNQRIAKACTRKGTRANVLSLKGPSGVLSPAEFDLVKLKKEIDTNLIDLECNICSWTIHGNLSIVCKKKISQENKEIIMRLYQDMSTQMEDVKVLNKVTTSFVKFVEVPLFDAKGKAYTREDFSNMLKQNAKWANIDLSFGPEIIKRHTEDTPLSEHISYSRRQ